MPKTIVKAYFYQRDRENIAGFSFKSEKQDCKMLYLWRLIIANNYILQLNRQCFSVLLFQDFKFSFKDCQMFSV